MHRLERLVEQLDSRSASDEMRVIQVQYATAQEMSDKITKLFEAKVNRPGQRPGSIARCRPLAADRGGAPGGIPGADGSSGGARRRSRSSFPTSAPTS